MSSPDCPESVEHAWPRIRALAGENEQAGGTWYSLVLYRNLYHTLCTWYLPNQRSWQGGTCCNGPTYAWSGMHKHYLYFYSGFDDCHHCYVCTCSTPLPIKQAISLVPEVVGRSVLARWIGLCLEGFGCQENVSVRTFGWEKLGAQQGCCGRTCHFCTCALE